MSISQVLPDRARVYLVYAKPFASKTLAFDAALLVIKLRMDEKVGCSDTGNYNPKIIKATLKDIEKYYANSLALKT